MHANQICCGNAKSNQQKIFKSLYILCWGRYWWDYWAHDPLEILQSSPAYSRKTLFIPTCLSRTYEND